MSFMEAFLHPQYLDLVWFCLLGVVSSCLFSFLPALHIYNVIGIFMWFMLQFEAMLEPMQLVSICMGMIVGYSILNTVPSTFFSPGDESLSYYVLPSSQYLAQGKGWEAVMLTGMGAVGGLVVLALLAPLLISILPGLRAITAPHIFWIIGAVVSFMILSEWPKGTSQSPSCLANLWEGWKYLGVGLVTFILSGILGFIVTSRTFVPVEFAFQSITPVFVGLFALPWLITNLICIGRIPRQHVSESVDLDWGLFTRGTFSGFLGGFTAAYIPIVTAGVGGLMSGHGTAQRDSRLFVMSFGTCKTVYYVGSFLFFFVPGISLTRGGLAYIITPVMTDLGAHEYVLVVGLMLFATGVSFLLLSPFTWLCMKLVEHVDYHKVSLVALVTTIVGMFFFTGWGGLALMTVATGIGLLPALFQARRMNLMAVLLVPVCLNMAGYGNDIVRFLGLE